MFLQFLQEIASKTMLSWLIDLTREKGLIKLNSILIHKRGKMRINKKAFEFGIVSFRIRQINFQEIWEK